MPGNSGWVVLAVEAGKCLSGPVVTGAGCCSQKTAQRYSCHNLATLLAVFTLATAACFACTSMRSVKPKSPISLSKGRSTPNPLRHQFGICNKTRHSHRTKHAAVSEHKMAHRPNVRTCRSKCKQKTITRTSGRSKSLSMWTWAYYVVTMCCMCCCLMHSLRQASSHRHSNLLKCPRNKSARKSTPSHAWCPCLCATCLLLSQHAYVQGFNQCCCLPALQIAQTPPETSLPGSPHLEC
jgi:hypothetical protein